VTIDEEGGGVERLGESFHRRNTTLRPARNSAPTQSFHRGYRVC
jgi:hypothetical protein